MQFPFIKEIKTEIHSFRPDARKYSSKHGAHLHLLISLYITRFPSVAVS